METVLTFARQAAFSIEEPSTVSSVRRAANDLAQRLGFNETAAGKVAIAITEAATNVAKHSGRGEILIRPAVGEAMNGIEILAIDSGPGMANLTLNMEDGVSSAGSYGVGLGAMRRLADYFDIYTAPGKGTVIYMVLWPDTVRAQEEAWQVGVVSLPLPGETVCGDTWAVSGKPACLNALVADGLGHGPSAAAASQAAAEIIVRHPDSPPAAALQDAHLAMRATRGAAVAIARLDAVAEEIYFAGIGNIAACIYRRQERHNLVSHNGIVGGNIRKIQEFTLPWDEESLLVMHSDGLGTKWDLRNYPGLEDCHPAVIAAILYRDFSRRRDDSTVLVVRQQTKQPTEQQTGR